VDINGLITNTYFSLCINTQGSWVWKATFNQTDWIL